MNDQNPAQTLRATVEQLRESATEDEWWSAVGGSARGPAHPSLAIVLADWLEHTAEFLDGVQQAHGAVTETAVHNSRHALAVARAVLRVSE